MKRVLGQTVLAGALLLATIAPALCADANIQAEREKSGTSCHWELDPHNPKEPKVRIISYLPAPAFHGERVGLVAKMGSGVALNSFSFEVHFTPQARVNVRPGVNVAYLDENNSNQMLRLSWNDLDHSSGAKDREKCSYNFVSKQKHALKVTSIAIGGKEMTYRTGGSTFPVDKTAPLDVSLCEFKGVESSGAALNTKYNLDVREISSSGNTSLSGLPCTVNK